jgi:hypothetical protein
MQTGCRKSQGKHIQSIESLYCSGDVNGDRNHPETHCKQKKTIEDDTRIVTNIRIGEAELKAGLGKRFKNTDDFIEHLANL